MKLKNKKTGAIIPGIKAIEEMLGYNSLAEFNEEWEDYNDTFPSNGDEYWSLSTNGNLYAPYKWTGSTGDKMRLELGNCFKTAEEANETIEKLKAIKRLKDAGVKIIEYQRRVDDVIVIKADISGEYSDKIEEDLRTIHLL